MGQQFQLGFRPRLHVLHFTIILTTDDNGDTGIYTYPLFYTVKGRRLHVVLSMHLAHCSAKTRTLSLGQK
jgi:hypothetical protein